MKSLIVIDTGVYGKGVFAGKSFKKGEIIHTLSGERMTLKELVHKVNVGKENIDDPFQIGKRTYIDLDALSRTFNHSCDPNGGLRKNSELFALRDIPKGEQITYDYSMTIAPTKWSMKCKCRSNNCRKVLGDIRSIPKSQIRKYEALGAVQRYMKEILKGLRAGTYTVPKYELEALSQLK